MTGQFVGNTRYLGTNAFWGTNDATTNANARQEDRHPHLQGHGERLLQLLPHPRLWSRQRLLQGGRRLADGSGKLGRADIAPVNPLISTDVSPAHASLGTRPVCHFPYYPKYTGAVGGDIKQASNYTCTKLDAYPNVR